MKAEYETALKQIYSKAPKENFLLIEFAYDDGLKFLSCLKQAELYTETYSKPKTIGPFNSDTFKTKVLSRKDYEDLKVSTLLGVTVEELYAKEEQPLPF